MKRAVLIICISCLSLPAFSQSCEERESRLVQGITGFSATVLYNTYGLIGSISDAFGNDVYDSKTVSNLLNAQKKLMDNLVELVEKMNRDSILLKPADINYASSSVLILKGLKKQAELMLEYARSKTPQRLENYEAQRTKNWSDISKLMGLKE